MAERKSGAGGALSGVLERTQLPRTVEDLDAPDAEAPPPAPKPRTSAAVPKPIRTADRAVKKIKGRTLYISAPLWERLIVQAHRKDMTISDYVCALLDRHVPDHRIVRAAATAVGDQTEGQGIDAA